MITHCVFAARLQQGHVCLYSNHCPPNHSKSFIQTVRQTALHDPTK